MPEKLTFEDLKGELFSLADQLQDLLKENTREVLSPKGAEMV